MTGRNSKGNVGRTCKGNVAAIIMLNRKELAALVRHLDAYCLSDRTGKRDPDDLQLWKLYQDLMEDPSLVELAEKGQQ